MIRDARSDELGALEALQRRSVSIWDEYRDLVAAYPDAVSLPLEAVEERRVRVATGDGGERLGFSVVLAVTDGVRELDGLFVAPEHMREGVGRALVADAASRARGSGAISLEVTAGPGAVPFYANAGFVPGEPTQTRFGPARRMRMDLGV